LADAEERRGAPFSFAEAGMRPDADTLRRCAGFGVHAFTASGSVCGLLATLEVLGGRFEAAFAWLFLALVIDGVDGSIARAVSVETTLPRFSGERLDFVVDYVTYVFVPVLALLQGGFLDGTGGVVVGAFILLSALYHFSDNESKADDYCFVGFPAVWNLVAFSVFAWGLSDAATKVVCVALATLTFVPMHWIHPMRVRRWFALNVAVAAAGLAAGVWVLATGFPGSLPAGLILACVWAYFLVMAIVWRHVEPVR
jgi:phosphatidylcholine synthase